MVAATTICCYAITLAVGGVATAAKAGGKPVKGATYTGTNSETGTVSFEVAKNGKDVLAFKTDIGYDGQCGQGGGPDFEVDVKSIAIHKGGKFTAKTKGVFPSSTLKVTPIALRITGKIKGSSASGEVAEVGGKCQSGAGNPYAETFTANAA